MIFYLERGDMMIIKKLKAGMTVYRVEKTTGLQRFNGKWNTWTIKIIEVDVENEKVLATSCGKTEWFGKHIWNKWRLKQPED